MHLPHSPDSRWYRLLPVAAMVVVAVADVLLSTDIGLLPVYAAGPALAASRGSIRWVLGAGALAVALCVASAVFDDMLIRTRVAVALVAIAYVTAAACVAAAARARSERELVEARAVSDTFERVLLSPLPRVLGPVALAASYVSAARTTRIGGDLYEAVDLPDRVRIIVADVQGKGLDAVRVASFVLAAFRESAPYARHLGVVGERIELALDRHSDDDRFVTAVLAEVTTDGSVLLLNHGHPPPLLLDTAGPPALIEPYIFASPLGMADISPAPARSMRLTLDPGDRMLLYTDGISEARSPEGRFYPLLDRAAGPLAVDDLDQALKRLRDDVGRFTRTASADDSALVLFEFCGEGEPGQAAA